MQNVSATSSIKIWFYSIPFTTRIIFSLNTSIYVVLLLFGLNDSFNSKYSINPLAIYNNPYQSYRFLTSAYLHGNSPPFLHLALNMMSFLPLGSKIEMKLGSLPFLYQIILFTLLSNLLYFIIAWTAFFIGYANFVYTSAIGFSGVLFSLLVVTTEIMDNQDSQSQRSIFGIFQVPKRLYPWALLILLSVIMPNVSFLGHLSGILVGYLYSFGYLDKIKFESFLLSLEKSNLMEWCFRQECFITQTQNNLPTTNQNVTNTGPLPQSWVSNWKSYFNSNQTENQMFLGEGNVLGTK